MSYRIEKDSLGEVQVPSSALYQAQTQRAVDNFKISDKLVAKEIIIALIDIKKFAASSNSKLQLLDPKLALAIENAASKAAGLNFSEQFPVSIMQTGSGTSTNMNVNEVLATLASQDIKTPIHPNDHVNLGQSSNDVFPSAIQIATVRTIYKLLLPSLNQLEDRLTQLSNKHLNSIKNGRTHLMDATPITFAQEFDCWRQQAAAVKIRIKHNLKELAQLPLGGTAVGNGINTHQDFAKLLCAELAQQDNIDWIPASIPAALMSAQEHTLHLASNLKNMAVFLLKIANDLRWMNSGPVSGLAEIQLAKLQPGSSIMPGKVNPVVPEAVAMACAEVIGNETAVTIAAQSGNFQLNVMLPLIGDKLMQSIKLLTSSLNSLSEQALKTVSINEEQTKQKVAMNPILVTALNPHIGYDAAAKIANIAATEGRSVFAVALEETNLNRTQLKEILDPLALTNQTKPKQI